MLPSVQFYHIMSFAVEQEPVSKNSLIDRHFIVECRHPLLCERNETPVWNLDYNNSVVKRTFHVNPSRGF